jgi:hypothetical protein
MSNALHLHARLERLEAQATSTRRSLRRWRAVSLASLLCVGALATMGQAPAEVVTATRLELKDASGTLRGLWSVKDGHSELAQFDENGRLRIALGAGAKGDAALAFKDADGNMRVGLTVGKNGTPGLIMTDGQETRIALGVNNGFATFALRDAAKKIRMLAFTDQEGNPGLRFKDADGKTSKSLP